MSSDSEAGAAAEPEAEEAASSWTTSDARSSEATQERETARGSTWQPNVAAPEFLPMVSVQCALVGICTFVVGVELQAITAGAMGSTAGAASAAAASMAAADERLVRPTRRGGARQRGQRWRRGLRAAGEASSETGGACSGAQEAPEIVSEEVWEQRAQHRRKVLLGLEARLLRLAAEGKPWDRQKEELLPARPEPEDRSLSRRQWRRATDLWFKESAMLRCPGGPGSVASTEECISTQWCDGEDNESSD